MPEDFTNFSFRSHHAQDLLYCECIFDLVVFYFIHGHLHFIHGQIPAQCWGCNTYVVVLHKFKMMLNFEDYLLNCKKHG